MESASQPGLPFATVAARLHRAKPFLKWAGGKQRFLFKYSHYLPEFTGRYIEPFLGGGAVFFHLARTQRRPFTAYLGDINPHLIRAYIEIRNRPDEVFEQLEILQAGYDRASEKPRYYYDVRDAHNARHPRTDAAAFIFLNRTCWNGLWRVNERGKFNVPYGQPKSARVIPSLEELQAASAALQLANLRTTTWQNTLGLAEPGDLVFLDPPYYSDVVQRDPSTKYQRRMFGLASHEQIALQLERLNQRGINFILTNSAEPEMVDLYKRHGLSVTVTALPRNINSKVNDRGNVPELLVTGGEEQALTSDRVSALLELEAYRFRVRAEQ